MAVKISKERKEKIGKLLEFFENVEDYHIYIEEIFEGENMEDWRDSLRVAQNIIASTEEE